jgi:CrcB protein
MRMLPPLMIVMAGGALGAGGRYLAGRAALAALGPHLPWGTLLVNLGGGLLMGLLAGALVRLEPAGEAWRLFLAVGVLGGFTTFSAFSLELYQMILRGQALLGLAYAVSSVAGSLALLWAGLLLVRAL